MLCCAALYCAVLYCILLYSTVMYSAVLCCAVLYCTVLYCIVLCCTLRCCAVLCCTVLYCTVLYCTVLYCTVHTVQYITILQSPSKQHGDFNSLQLIIWYSFSLSRILIILKFHTDKQHVLWENKSIDISIYSFVYQFIIELYFCLMKLPGVNLILAMACCCVIWSVSNTS